MATNIVKGNIGNALHSVAPDHIVTTADEIFDETSSQYQSQINQKVNDITAKGYKFGGFVTPSSSPISGAEKYFYIATQNGTYVNFGGVVLNNETAILYNTDSQHSTTAKCGQAVCGYAICGTN